MKILVYTAITGGYEKPREDIRVETLDLFKDPMRSARMHKCLTPDFKEYDFSIWIDGNTSLKVTPEFLIKELGDNDILVYSHWRDCIYDEATAEKEECIALKKPIEEIKAIDRELEELLKKQSARVKVVGVGGAGNNTLSRMREVGIKGGEIIAINTDAQDLLYTNADHKILIGREISKGLGAGSNPRIGMEAAKESIQEIKKKLEGADMIFITCGLGGGTGTGAAPVVAEVAKKMGALTIGVVTLPFTVEGRKRIENAVEGLERMESLVDTLIIIPNDKLLELAPDLPLTTAFKVADEILTNSVKGITELVTRSGLVNLDFADIRAVMSNGGVSLIGLGESDSKNRALDAVEKAINNPLLDVDISGANRALVNVSGGTDMTLREAELIVETVSTKIHSSSHIIWGAMVDESMPKNHIQAMVVIAGGRFPYLEDGKAKKNGAEPIDLGIEFT